MLIFAGSPLLAGRCRFIFITVRLCSIHIYIHRQALLAYTAAQKYIYTFVICDIRMLHIIIIIKRLLLNDFTNAYIQRLNSIYAKIELSQK